MDRKTVGPMGQQLLQPILASRLRHMGQMRRCSMTSCRRNILKGLIKVRHVIISVIFIDEFILVMYTWSTERSRNLETRS